MKMQIRSGSLPVGSRTTDGSGRSAKKKKKADTKSSSSPSLSSKKNEFVPSFREAMKVKVKIIDIDILKRFTGERREEERKKKKKKEKKETKKKNTTTNTKQKDAKAVISVSSSRDQSPPPTPSSTWLSYCAFGATVVTTVAAGAFFSTFAKKRGERGKREENGDDASLQPITFAFDTPQTAAVRNKSPRPPRRSEDQHQREQQEILRRREEKEVNPFLKQMEDSNVAFSSQQIKSNIIPRPSSSPPPQRLFETEPSSGKSSPRPSSSTGYVVPKQVEAMQTRETSSTAAAVFDGKKVDELKKEFNQWALSYDDELHPWDRALDNKRYDAIATPLSSSSTVEEESTNNISSSSISDALIPESEKREKETKVREVARRRRNSYFAAISSKRYAPTTIEQLALEEKVRER